MLADDSPVMRRLPALAFSLKDGVLRARSTLFVAGGMFKEGWQA